LNEIIELPKHIAVTRDEITLSSLDKGGAVAVDLQLEQAKPLVYFSR
jgi:hypothetical protein